MPTINRDHEQQAATLVEAFKLRGYHADLVQNSPVHAVNVWAEDADRHPRHTITVDADGYTWGRSWEYNRPHPIGPADVAQAIIKTFPEGVR